MPLVGTKDKILSASLTLFNELGERNVTTNHIAAHLTMSPGNVCYDCRKKQVSIHASWHQYLATSMDILDSQTVSSLQLQDKLHYLEVVFSAFWIYRVMQ